MIHSQPSDFLRQRAFPIFVIAVIAAAPLAILSKLHGTAGGTSAQSQCIQGVKYTGGAPEVMIRADGKLAQVHCG